VTQLPPHFFHLELGYFKIAGENQEEQLACQKRGRHVGSRRTALAWAPRDLYRDFDGSSGRFWERPLEIILATCWTREEQQRSPTEVSSYEHSSSQPYILDPCRESQLQWMCFQTSGPKTEKTPLHGMQQLENTTRLGEVLFIYDAQVTGSQKVPRIVVLHCNGRIYDNVYLIVFGLRHFFWIKT
jgi:hypothetical protein